MDNDPPSADVEKLIEVVRGRRVLLSDDVVALYGVTPRVLMHAVRRNAESFPDDFAFLLTAREAQDIGLGVSPPLCAFTAEGVGMVSTILDDPRAVQVHVAIVRAVVKGSQVRQATDDADKQAAVIEACLAECEEEKGEHGPEVREVFEAIRLLLTPPVPPGAGN